MDLYSVCVNQVNIQIESYFIDQKYQFLKSKPLTKEQKALQDGKSQIKNPNGLHK